MLAKDYIAIVSPTHNPYSETFISNHIQYLPGKKVAIYAFGHDAHFGNGNNLLKMNKLSRLFRLIERRMKGLTYLDQELKTLIKFFNKEKISCVLAEYGITGAKLMKACHSKGIPLVVHFHGYDASRTDILKQYGVLYQKMFKDAKAIVVVSADMKKRLIALGAEAEKVRYIPYGIDLTLFKQNEARQASRTFLSVGRFVEKKAPYLTILAFQKAYEKIRDAKLVMVGDGPLLSVCKQLVKSLNIEESVEFKGILSNGEVARLMEDVFCFVQHSITAENGDAEGTPLAILEASASALPIVSTRHAGIKDAVRHAETGFLVEEGDIQGMAGYMIMLLEDQDMANSFGRKGRHWIEKNYNLKDKIAELWELLKE